MGRALRWRLRGLGMDVLAYDPYAPDATSSLDELFERSDVISVHAPVTEETTGMIGKDEFAKMRDGVVYLNTARAKIHDTDALVAALRSGKVGAAGLDHFEGESLATDHPLTEFPYVVLTPHIGGATYNTEANHTATIAEDLCRLMAGARPLHIVNPEVLPADVTRAQPTIIADSIGFQPEGPDPQNIRPGPSYQLAAELAQAGAHPRICMIATAVGDDSTRLAAVHNAFSKLGMVSSHLTLFPMPNVPDMRAHLLAQDVIWVSGGSTANLLALWRLHGLDVILRECWESGVVLKGVSAGSLCWHVGGTTDSFGPELADGHQRPGVLALQQQPAPRRRGAAAAPDPSPDRRGHPARRLRHRERHRARLLRHRTPRGLHRSGGEDGLLAGPRRGTTVPETALPTRLL